MQKKTLQLQKLVKSRNLKPVVYKRSKMSDSDPFVWYYLKYK